MALSICRRVGRGCPQRRVVEAALSGRPPPPTSTLPRREVWRALTDPDTIQRYFFGSRVDTGSQPGSPITWAGEYNGTAYVDKGTVLEVQQDLLLRVTHFSPMTGLPDVPENYHTLTFELHERGTGLRGSP